MASPPPCGLRRGPVGRQPARSFGDVGAAELGDWEVAADEVARLQLHDGRIDYIARALDEAVAAGVEDAARRRVRRAGDLAAEPDAARRLAVDARHRRQERL